MPSWRKIKNSINALDGRKHFLMCSGGVDSMFLLDMYSNCEVDFDVIHFRHGIRENDHLEGDMIREWVDNFNATNARKIQFHLGEGNLNSTSSEGEARNQRWNYVESILSDYDEPIVVTAHHLNDNVEHALMKLVSGSPHNSLSMKAITDFGTYIKFKPLLAVTKEEILEQISKRAIPFIEDVTNSVPNCDRNIWRNVLIPQLMERRNIVRAMKPHLVE